MGDLDLSTLEDKEIRQRLMDMGMENVGPVTGFIFRFFPQICRRFSSNVPGTTRKMYEKKLVRLMTDSPSVPLKEVSQISAASSCKYSMFSEKIYRKSRQFSDGSPGKDAGVFKVPSPPAVTRVRRSPVKQRSAAGTATREHPEEPDEEYDDDDYRGEESYEYTPEVSAFVLFDFKFFYFKNEICLLILNIFSDFSGNLYPTIDHNYASTPTGPHDSSLKYRGYTGQQVKKSIISK